MPQEGSHSGLSGILELERAIQMIQSQGLANAIRNDEPISPGDVSRLAFDDIDMTDITRPVRFRSLYPNSPNDVTIRRELQNEDEDLPDVVRNMMNRSARRRATVYGSNTFGTNAYGSNSNATAAAASTSSVSLPRFDVSTLTALEEDNRATLILLRDYIGASQPEGPLDDVNVEDRSALGFLGEQPTQLETSFKYKLRKLRTFGIKDFAVPASSFIQPGITFHGTQTNVLHASRSSNYENQQTFSVKLEVHHVDRQSSTFSGSLYSKEAAAFSSAKATTNKSTRRSLHGELIDFKNNSWRTGGGPANILRDIYFWHSLPPFSATNYYRFLTNALTEEFLRSIYKDYILLRWTINDDEDEDDHSKPAEDRQKLHSHSNTKYYYVSLNRMSGHMEGYYADRSNQTPNQLITLNPSLGMCLPAYSLR